MTNVWSSRDARAASPLRTAGTLVADATSGEVIPVFEPWTYQADRYYYGWYGLSDPRWSRDMSDHQIKSTVVDRLRRNPYTEPFDLKVDVKERVVILQGDVDSRLAKRAAGDDAWDVAAVKDVSNLINVRG